MSSREFHKRNVESYNARTSGIGVTTQQERHLNNEHEARDLEGRRIEHMTKLRQLADEKLQNKESKHAATATKTNPGTQNDTYTGETKFEKFNPYYKEYIAYELGIKYDRNGDEIPQYTREELRDIVNNFIANETAMKMVSPEEKQTLHELSGKLFDEENYFNSRLNGRS